MQKIMKTFVEQIKEYRDNYFMGFWSLREAEGMALDYAVQYIGLKRWTKGYENIIRSMFRF